MSFLALYSNSGARQALVRSGMRNWPRSPRFFSSNSSAVQPGEKEAPVAAEGKLLEGTNTKNLGDVIRHGPGDSVITLNVGGKEFNTLRSTVNSNPVLADHVARAEANKEITKNGAVFIDRDPEHFPFILRHLRNRVEMIASSDKTTGVLGGHGSMTKWTKANIELPKDGRVLRELYTEATFYRVTELKETLCAKSWLANIVSFFNKNSNPFDSATKLLARLRAGLIAMGSVGTVGGTVFVTLQQDLDALLEKLGLQKMTKAVKPTS